MTAAPPDNPAGPGMEPGSKDSRTSRHLFDASVHFTGSVEYGYTLAQAAAGVPVPEGGARFDVFFEGEIRGERLSGTVTGVDYVSLTPEGATRLHIHGHIITPDGAHVAFQSEGTVRRTVVAAISDVEEHLSFSTAAENYRWLNRVRAEGHGTVDTRCGHIELTVTYDPHQVRA